MAFDKTISISSRSTGKILIDGYVQTQYLQSYDTVQCPGFTETNVLPIATRIVARTLSADLVAVQPLALPTRQLIYQYSDIWNTWKNHTFTVDEFFDDDTFEDY